MDRRNILSYLLWLPALLLAPIGKLFGQKHICGQECIWELEERVNELESERNELIRSRDGWNEIANQHCRNEFFYRDLLHHVGIILGPEAFTSDDGSVQDTPLALKIPPLVLKLRDEHHEYHDVICDLHDQVDATSRLAERFLGPHWRGLPG